MGNRRTFLPGFVAAAALEQVSDAPYAGGVTAASANGIQPAFCNPRECRRVCLREVCDSEWGGRPRCNGGECQCNCF